MSADAADFAGDVGRGVACGVVGAALLLAVRIIAAKPRGLGLVRGARLAVVAGAVLVAALVAAVGLVGADASVLPARCESSWSSAAGRLCWLSCICCSCDTQVSQTVTSVFESATDIRMELILGAGTTKPHSMVTSLAL